MKCEHKDFDALVKVNRLEDSGRFNAEVSIKCTECGEPFRFLGLPCGLDLNGAAVSADGEEACLAIGTAETVANIMDGNCPVGFTVRRESAGAAGEPAAIATKLLQAIRKHRDQRGDDRCWMDDEELYAALPEGYTPPARDTAVMLKHCERFIVCRENPKTEYVSPEREIERLKGVIDSLKRTVDKMNEDASPQ